jgi:hypothetical protein
VSWSSHIEVWQQPSRSVTWSSHVEVFIIPARECAPKDNDLDIAMSVMDRTRDDCASRASTTKGAASPPPEKKT